MEVLAWNIKRNIPYRTWPKVAKTFKKHQNAPKKVKYYYLDFKTIVL